MTRAMAPSAARRTLRGHRLRLPLRQSERDSQPEQEAPDEIEHRFHLAVISFRREATALRSEPGWRDRPNKRGDRAGVGNVIPGGSKGKDLYIL